MESMGFQGIPDGETLEARMAALERRVEALEEGHLAVVKKLTGPREYGYAQVGVAQPQTVREKQDAARRRPLFKAMEKVPKTDEGKG